MYPSLELGFFLRYEFTDFIAFKESPSLKKAKASSNSDLFGDFFHL